MREILFRGKRVDNGEWVCGDLLQVIIKEKPLKFIIPHGVSCEKDEKISVLQIEVIPETVGQSTGLTGKNGIKIFEGDIFQWLGFEVHVGKQIRPTRKIIVEYKYDVLFGIRNIIESNGTGKIIGNIYDNKL